MPGQHIDHLLVTERNGLSADQMDRLRQRTKLVLANNELSMDP
jgi:hypothetical protein